MRLSVGQMVNVYPRPLIDGSSVGAGPGPGPGAGAGAGASAEEEAVQLDAEGKPIPKSPPQEQGFFQKYVCPADAPLCVSGHAHTHTGITRSGCILSRGFCYSTPWGPPARPSSKRKGMSSPALPPLNLTKKNIKSLVTTTCNARSQYKHHPLSKIGPDRRTYLKCAYARFDSACLCVSVRFFMTDPSRLRL